MKGPIARATIRTTFVLGMRLLVQASTLLLVAHALGSTQFGAFAGVASLALMLGSLSGLGTHLVLLGEVARRPTLRFAILSYAIPTTLACGAALLVIYLIVCRLALDTPINFVPLIAIGFTETVLQPLLSLCITEHHGMGRIARSQLLQTSPLVLRLTAASVVIVLNAQNPLTLYSIGYLLASSAAFMLGLMTLPTKWPSPPEWRRPTRNELSGSVSYAAINLTKAGPSELDKTLATKLLSLPAAGVYAAGARVIGAVILPVTAMTLSSIPRLFRNAAEEPNGVKHLLSKMFASAFGYSAAAAVALWLVAPIFPRLFGAEYGGLKDVVRWLCAAVPGMALRLTSGNVLMALGRPWMRVAFEAAGLLVLALASIVLTTTYGNAGMPMALACSEWSMAIIGAALVAKVARRTTGCRSEPNGSKRGVDNASA